MDESFLDLLGTIVDGRNAFFRGMNRITNSNRDAILSRYLLNELCMMEFANRVHQNYIRTQQTTAHLTFNIPANFLDPVQVSVSPQQIQDSTETLTSPPADTQCAICQENITSDATRIRHCQHTFHRSCLNTWFSMSVRCPVCRHDIRGTGQLSQTSADDE
jgi:hypothetical protein